jgi:hypothetical protein
MDVVDAAWDLDLGSYADWGAPERVIVNVDAIYAELDPGHKRLTALQSFGEMGRYGGRPRGPTGWRPRLPIYSRE